MDGEIILNRSSTHVMKLDDNEQALMNEIEIDIPRPQPVKKQMPRPMKTQITGITEDWSVMASVSGTPAFFNWHQA